MVLMLKFRRETDISRQLKDGVMVLSCDLGKSRQVTYYIAEAFNMSEGFRMYMEFQSGAEIFSCGQVWRRKSLGFGFSNAEGVDCGHL